MISLSDRKAQKLWKRLFYKKSDLWVYLKNQLAEAMGKEKTDPVPARQLTLKIRTIKLEHRLKIAWSYISAGLIYLFPKRSQYLNIVQHKKGITYVENIVVRWTDEK